jgi:hypothetical protein
LAFPQSPGIILETTGINLLTAAAGLSSFNELPTPYHLTPNFYKRILCTGYSPIAAPHPFCQPEFPAENNGVLDLTAEVIHNRDPVETPAVNNFCSDPVVIRSIALTR